MINAVSNYPYPLAPVYSPPVIAEAAVCGALNRTEQPPLYGKRHMKVTLLRPEEYAFEESVTELLLGKNLEIKKDQNGMHSSPILYDADTGKPIAIFKPNEGWLTTVKWGDVLAYRLDHGSFAHVPYAFRLAHLPEHAPQREYFLSGSFVEWVTDAREMTATEQLHLLHEDRQAISILNMRLGNFDSNNANILVTQEGRLVSIDHDMVLSQYKGYHDACYSEMPLLPKCRDYILNLDLAQDIKILEEFEVSRGEIENYVIRMIFLKLAAEPSLEKAMTIDEIETIMEATKLPSGQFGNFFDNWIYHHPLRRILDSCSKPYKESELKEAFRASFNSYREGNSLNTWYISTIQKTIRSFYCSKKF